MVRTAVVYVFPAALLALGWLRLEEPRAAGADWLWVTLLALAPALAPRRWQRLALTPPAALVALWLALDRTAADERQGFFVAVGERLGDGFMDFYDITVPFSGAEQPHMHGVVVLAIFGFCLVLAHAAAERRPLVAALAVIGGAGWPAALYPADSVAYGAVILAAALWVLAGLRIARPVPALVAGAVLIAVAAGASTSAAIAKDGVLAWEQWDPNGPSRVPVSVSYVWEGNYGGIEFPKEQTTLLRIRGPERRLYWRATTLDQFVEDRWLENPTPIATGVAAGPLPSDELLPQRAADRRNWVRQEVEVVSLSDSRIAAAAQPVALDAAELGGAVMLSDGLVRISGGLERGQRYVVHSFAPDPKPAQLARIGPDYPESLDRFLEIGRTRVDPFGVSGRELFVDNLFADERYFALWPYRELWEQARRLRAGARTPYGAVVAIETWLRSTGGFTYEEQPARPQGLPPLAHFVAEGRAGYCQHFAGAMALMLRFLGIPARVAAGFTSGTQEDGAWTVTDHNAHAWVEVWFPGFGWLPFDPTPGRGELAGEYSASSTGFNVGDAAEAFGSGSGAGAAGGGIDQLRLREQLEARRLEQVSKSEEGRSVLWIVLLLAAGAVGAIGLVKLARRRLRYLTRDPRRLATATRRELADFLADQGLALDGSATPEDLRALVHHELGADARPFARAVAEARFGPPASSAAAAERARRELRTLLRVLRRSFGRTARLRGLVSLRSLRA